MREKARLLMEKMTAQSLGCERSSIGPGRAGLVASAAVLVAAAWAGLGGTAMAAVPGSTFASPSAKAGNAGTSCATASYSSIEAAIAAAAPGSTVVACPGTYHGGVVVTKPLTLLGVDATVDAAGSDNGITVPVPGVTVEGFTVEGAIGEGVLVVGKPGHPVTHVAIIGNVVKGNDLGNPTGGPISTSHYRECNASGKVPGDCGEGIHLMVVASSVVSGNLVEDNSGGILVTDEFGPSDHNVIEYNVVRDNVLDCGITMPSHSTTAFVKGHLVPAAGGVYDNVVEHNTVIGNGTKGQGAGVLLAVAAPGGADYDNTVADNTIEGNGQSGVTVHMHAPGQYLDGNVVEGNTIGVNDITGDFDFSPPDRATTGVLVGAVGPLTITVKANTISGNTYGIWYSAPVSVLGASANSFLGDQADQYKA
ncbi:MAG: right-handed parallel beta-helix repeat-containing protein [Acidimicrobiales bacterium]